MSKKKPLIILTVMILGVVIFFCIKSRTNGNYEPVTERADVFPGIEEFVSLSDKIGAYVENVSYMVKDISGMGMEKMELRRSYSEALTFMHLFWKESPSQKAMRMWFLLLRKALLRSDLL